MLRPHFFRLLPLWLFAALMQVASVVRADTWTIRADYWCPYNCQPDDANPGYMIEILQRAAKRHGHTVDYKLMPWPRALEQAREGRITGVVGMVESNRDGLLVSDRMGVDATCVFVRRDNAFAYRKPEDLNRLSRIGTVEGYGYPDEFMAWKAANPHKVQALAGDDTMTMQAQKLAAGRIDAFIENINVVRYAQRTLPDLRQARSAGCMHDEDLFFGYSLKLAHAAIIKQQVDQELAILRKNGELRKLLDKYGVKPW